MISVVQSFTAKSSFIEGIVPIQFRYPSAVGNAIVIVIKWVGTGVILSVTDNVGNKYIQGPSAVIESGASAINLQIWYAYPTTAQTGTITELMVDF